jgi:hypothetical protein
METKKYAIVENGVVLNIVVATPEYAEEQGWVEAIDPTEDASGTEIGGLYEDGQFLPKPRDIEAEWAQVRTQRDALLEESDVYVLPDRWAAMTPEQQTAWSTYRQELRDIPETYSDPAEVIWPIKPE